ncbi:hypothetical protein, conserved [Leishmania shawi]|uniref:Uncharacterized protein n=1 Tax=Leishmania shawi TaxID=5680 RepID=A0ABR3DYG1_9TRYP
MRCSAAFLFSSTPPAFADTASGLPQHSSQPPPGTYHLDYESQTGLKDRAMHRVVCCPGNVSTRGCSRAPRPVTARQLCRAILGMNHADVRAAAIGKHCDCHATQEPHTHAFSSASTCISSAACGGGDEVGSDRHGLCDAVSSARLGEGTIQLDSVACHRVVVCGRIVRCVDAFSNGSVAAATGAVTSSVAPTVMPYDLLWLSDATGVVCVLRFRPALVHARTLVSAPSSLYGGWPGVSACDWRNHTLAASAGGLSDVFAADDIDGAAHPSLPPRAGVRLANGSVCHPTPEAQQCATEVYSAKVAHRAISYGMDVTAAIANFGLEHEDDCVLDVNDYVVCVGSLAFADVDVQMKHALQPYASDLRQSTWAAATSSWPLFSVCPGVATSSIGAGDDVDAMDCAECGTDGNNGTTCGKGAAASAQGCSVAVPPSRHQYVLLPSSEVPLTLDAARTELGLVGSLPSSTRYLTAAEAAQWGSTPRDCPSYDSTLSLPTAPALHDRNGGINSAVSADCGTSTPPGCAVADMNEVPLMGIKGYTRLVLDTNECLFWWLAAVETHLRLRAHASAHPIHA